MASADGVESPVNVCTHCDINYLPMGLALHYSLKPFNAILHWLCHDEKTFEKVSLLENTIAYRLSELEQDPELVQAKQNQKCEYGTQHSQYCWTLTPYFVNYLLKKIDQIIYADSDIYFYHNPRIIIEKCAGRLGIHSHRFTSRYKKDNPVGEFNVGVMSFERQHLDISNIWKNWLLKPDHQYRYYGTCGDQKYLDLFPKLFHGRICIFDREGIGYAAPWTIDYEYLPDNQIMWQGKSEPLAFIHFAHVNKKEGTWKDSEKGEWNPATHKQAGKYYTEYFSLLNELCLTSLETSK